MLYNYTENKNYVKLSKELHQLTDKINYAYKLKEDKKKEFIQFNKDLEQLYSQIEVPKELLVYWFIYLSSVIL